MPDDPIAQVQALVGCPHVWGGDVSPTKDPIRFFVCIHCGEKIPHDEVCPEPAPDCSTLWGAVKAAQAIHGFDNMKFLTALASLAGALWHMMGTSEMTEREAATAICELTPQAIQENEG